jgi:hypothetical protein
MLSRSKENYPWKKSRIKKKNQPFFSDDKTYNDELNASVKKYEFKKAKVVLVDLKNLINLNKNHFNKTKSFTTASLFKLKNLEYQYKNINSLKQSNSSEFKNLLENFKKHKESSCSHNFNESCFALIKYDRLLDDNDDLNNSL